MPWVSWILNVGNLGPLWSIFDSPKKILLTWKSYVVDQVGDMMAYAFQKSALWFLYTKILRYGSALKVAIFYNCFLIIMYCKIMYSLYCNWLLYIKNPSNKSCFKNYIDLYGENKNWNKKLMSIKASLQFENGWW